jgi:hypothetical protein
MMIDRCRTPAANFELPNANLPTRKHRHTVVIMSFLSLLKSKKVKINGKKNSIKCQVVRKQKVTRVVSFSPDLKRFRLFRDGSLLDIRKLRVGCNRNAFGGEEKDGKKIHTHTLDEQISSILLKVYYTLYFPFSFYHHSGV